MSLKKTLLLVPFLLFCVMHTQAQTTGKADKSVGWKQMLVPQGNDFFRHEIRLTGSINSFYRNSFYRDTYNDLCTQYNLREIETFCFDVGIKSAGWSLGYYYRLNKRWAIGCMGGSSISASDGLFAEELYKPSTLNDSVYQGGNLRSKNWYIVPSVKVNWAFFNGSLFYSKLGFGLQQQRVTFHPSEYSPDIPRWDKRKWKTAWQVSVFGVEAGRRTKIFAELGYGWQGFFNIGVSHSWQKLP